uniref:Uncharacterized protein TCIL3000_11_9810 n=1 Tax=Trypanosoma congolense (strain IL3000) TaxID=1068625 RepID=G0V1J3_TRYCI|nr:unnamed protein product [Trypanosoma congolense IL3000]
MVENERLRALLEDYSRRTQDDEERLTAPSDVIALYERSLGLGHEFSIPSIDTQNNFIASGAAAIGSSINGTNISGGGGSPEANGGSDAEVHNGFHVSKGSVGESGGYKSVSRGSISKGSVGKIVGAAPGGSASHERLDEASAEGRSTGVDGESEEAESAIPQPEAEGSVRRESVSKGSVAEVVGAATGGSASHERLDEASAEGRSTGVDGESEEAESAIPQPEAEGSVRRESVSKGSVRKESVSKGSVAEVVGAATGGSASRERLDEASAEGRSTGVDGESEEAESAIPQPEAEGSVGREPANVVDRSEDCDESSAGRKPTDDEDGVSDRANGDVWLADAGESNSRGSAGENRGTTAEDFDSEG